MQGISSQVIKVAFLNVEPTMECVLFYWIPDVFFLIVFIIAYSFCCKNKWKIKQKGKTKYFNYIKKLNRGLIRKPIFSSHYMWRVLEKEYFSKCLTSRFRYRIWIVLLFFWNNVHIKWIAIWRLLWSSLKIVLHHSMVSLSRTVKIMNISGDLTGKWIGRP